MPARNPNIRPVVATALAVTALLIGCVDGHEDHHHIPPEVEAEAALMTLPMALGQAEYGPANWVKAVNYTTAWRGKGQITTLVIHTVQGSYKGCISWFQNPKAKVSAHYVIGKNGEITQMVKEKDIAWHVGSANGYTIGFEHEGYVSDPNWATPKMLDASAKLACHLVKKYGLKATKTHIKGHVELPKQTHTDPGKHWPWATYMKKVQDCVGGKVEPPPKAGCCGLKVKSSGSTVIDNTGNNCIQKYGNPKTWWNATDSGWGGSMNYTYTANVSYPDNWARWRLTFAKAGKYKVDAWIPAKHAGAPVTYKIKHGGVVSKAKVNQKVHSNKWINLGTWTFKGNCDEWVVLEDAQGVKGIQMGVDAIRLTPAGQPPKCPASCSDKNPCTTDSCSNGNCVHKNNTAACSDGNPCTLGDKCTAGKCKWKVWKSCGDNNACTDDYCDQKSGVCKAKNNSKPCNDGNACTKGDVCKSGTCTPGAGAKCGDGNPCTKDTCNPKGGCSHSPTSGGCDDGNPCTSKDNCKSGSCKGVAKICDDGNPCTDDFCGAKGCGTKANKMFCDDGNGCTTGDKCIAGACKGTPNACKDGSDCTVDSCKNGACSHVVAPGACDDGNACTSDVCGPSGCSNPPLDKGACDDGSACTGGDICKQGVCAAGLLNGCDDGDGCTMDRCVNGACENDPIPGCSGRAGDKDAGQQDGDGGDGGNKSNGGADATTPGDGGLGNADGITGGDVGVTMMAAPASGCGAAPQRRTATPWGPMLPAALLLFGWVALRRRLASQAG